MTTEITNTETSSNTNTKPIRVLLIEDNSGDARIIREELNDVLENPFELQHVSQLQEGMDYLANHQADIILTDLSLPDSPGVETFRRLHNQISNVPVVVLTGFDNESMALDAVREGAQDYLIKGQVDGRILSRTIFYAIERHRSQSTLRNLSVTDDLTGLHNRRGFMSLGEQALRAATRAKSNLVLMYFDLDGLKQINDTHGHPFGDRALTGASKVLKQTFRQADIVARIGGDEFSVISGEDVSGGYSHLISRLQGNLALYNLQHAGEPKVSLSFGIARFNADQPTSLTDLMAAADQDLYANRSRIRGQSQFESKENRVRRLVWLLLLLLLVGTIGAYQLWNWLLSKPIHIPPFIPAHRAHFRQAPKVAVIPQQGSRSAIPPPLTLHRELIPVDIEIVRFTYGQPVHQPGTTFRFNIVGSGFTQSFEKSLTVYSGSPHVQVRNLRRVTINQIQGDMVIQPEAPTQYVFPHVLINQKPVFQAATPFAIIRQGDVLDIVFTQMDPDGKGGHFRVYTNLDSEMSKNFAVRSETTGLSTSDLRHRPPYIVDGTLRIEANVPRGDYPLSAWAGSQQLFRKEHLIKVIRPTIGNGGVIQSLAAPQRYIRPGDSVRITLEGRGFKPEDSVGLTVRAANSGEAPLRYISQERMETFLDLGSSASEGVYDAGVYHDGELIYPAKRVFTVVGANWLGKVSLLSSARAGQKTTLLISGRDFSTQYAQRLTIESEDPGIHVARPLWIGADTLNAEMDIDPSVKAGDYLLELRLDGQVVQPAERPIITVQP